MQVTVEEINSVKKIMHIEVPEKEVEKEINQAYSQLKKEAKVKGFRPGKAPRAVLERIYKKKVNGDILPKLIQNSFVEAVQETKINFIGQPKMDIPDFDGTGAIQYKATVEITPEIGNIDFQGLELKKKTYQTSDAEVDMQLSRLQNQLAELKEIEENRPVKEMDFVIFDYEGFKDNEPYDETQKTANMVAKIGDARIHQVIDEQMIGMNIGDEKDIVVNFPDDYKNPKLANQEILFKVKLNGIKETLLPEINDDFAKDIGQYENLEALKNGIRENIQQGYDKRIEQELSEQVFLELINRTEFELPEVLVEAELDRIVYETERMLAYQNKSLDDINETKESIRQKYPSVAEKQVQRFLILNQLITQENMTLSDEEMEKGFTDFAATNGTSIEAIKQQFQQKKEMLAEFKQALLEKKMMKLIIDSSTVIEIDPEAEDAIAEDNQAE